MKRLLLLLAAGIVLFACAAAGEEVMPIIWMQERELALSYPMDTLRRDLIALEDGQFVLYYAAVSGESELYGELTNEYLECYDEAGNSLWAVTLDTDHVLYEAALLRYPDHILWFTQFGDELPSRLTRLITAGGVMGEKEHFYPKSDAEVYSPVSAYPFIIDRYFSGSSYEQPIYRMLNTLTGAENVLTCDNEWADCYALGDQLLLYLTDIAWPPREDYRPRVMVYSAELKKICEAIIPGDVPEHAAPVSVTKRADGLQLIFETDDILGTGGRCTYLGYTLNTETGQFSPQEFTCTVPEIQSSLCCFVPCEGGFLTCLSGPWRQGGVRQLTLCHLSRDGVLTRLESLGDGRDVRLISRTEDTCALLIENGEGQVYLRRYGIEP